MASRSALVRTPPVGLAGELITSIRVRGVTSEASSSRSSRKSFSIADRDGTGVAPTNRVMRLVDRVSRVRNEDLVARVDEPQDRVEHHALPADGDEHAVRRDREALAGRRVLGDRLAQRRDPGNGA